ncbi:MAG: hypothetical protein LZF61_01400 [Nitrosomonas sp.]|nr:MAG: hypothetical protein LZF61_01400 [Nitrosomonas sp.]
MRHRLSFFLIVIMMLAAGCGGLPIQQPIPGKKPVRPAGPLPESAKPKYNLTGYPESTQQGYIDGCETAKSTKWAFKDLNRYQKDEQYRMGWDDGYSLCRLKK